MSNATFPTGTPVEGACASEIAKRLGQACRQSDAERNVPAANFQLLMRDLLEARVETIADAQAAALWGHFVLGEVVTQLAEGVVVTDEHRLLMSLAHALCGSAAAALEDLSGLPASAVVGDERFRQ